MQTVDREVAAKVDLCDLALRGWGKRADGQIPPSYALETFWICNYVFDVT